MYYLTQMDRGTVIERILGVEDALRRQGVRALFLYGSHARDEARPDSDLDILVELSPPPAGSLEDYLAPYHLLQQRFPGMRIGYGTHDDIVPHYRHTIERTAIQVF